MVHLASVVASQHFEGRDSENVGRSRCVQPGIRSESSTAGLTQSIQTTQSNATGNAQISGVAESKISISQSRPADMNGFRTLEAEQVKAPTEALP